jgi:hypothetical protein
MKQPTALTSRARGPNCPTFTTFYGLLNDEQKARLVAMGISNNASGKQDVATKQNSSKQDSLCQQWERMFGSAMGEFTVAQEGEGWIVLEDGRRVGGTLRYPFPSREAAQRYVQRELAGEAEMMAKGDLALSAKARAIRETDAELWALFLNIEEEFAGEDEAALGSRHSGICPIPLLP